MRLITIPRSLASLVLLLALRPGGHAQSITAAELLAPIGPEFHVYAVQNLFPWDTLAGTNAVWDYAWMEVDSAMDLTFSVIDVNSAPAAPQFPAADRAVRSVGDNGNYVIDRFFTEDAAALHELGSSSPGISYAFTQPDLVYAFPMDMGDTVRGDYCYWSDGFGVQFNFCGESYVTFDAMGTLVLPYGSFTGVKHVTHWSSSFENTTPSADSSYLIRQQWFLPGVAWPVLDVQLYVAEDGGLYASGKLVDAADATGLGERRPTAAWTLAPNPAVEDVRVSGLPSDVLSISLYAMDGRRVREVTGPFGGNCTVPLNDLGSGSYVVQVLTANGPSTRVLVKP